MDSSVGDDPNPPPVSYLGCRKCSGLFTTPYSFYSHAKVCDADPNKSQCEFFACKKQVFLKNLCIDKKSPTHLNDNTDAETPTSKEGQGLSTRTPKAQYNYWSCGIYRTAGALASTVRHETSFGDLALSDNQLAKNSKHLESCVSQGSSTNAVNRCDAHEDGDNTSVSDSVDGFDDNDIDIPTAHLPSQVHVSGLLDHLKCDEEQSVQNDQLTKSLQPPVGLEKTTSIKTRLRSRPVKEAVDHLGSHLAKKLGQLLHKVRNESQIKNSGRGINHQTMHDEKQRHSFKKQISNKCLEQHEVLQQNEISTTVHEGESRELEPGTKCSSATCRKTTPEESGNESENSVFAKHKSTESNPSLAKQLRTKGSEAEIMEHCSKVTKDGRILYKCNLCGHESGHVGFMARHLKAHNAGDIFRCDKCKFTCFLKCRLNAHMERHSRRVLCDYCPATFTDLSSLNRHVNSKHKVESRYKCLQCGYLATCQAVLKDHMRTHTGDLLCCDYDGCKFSTAYLRALTLHKEKHKGLHRYVCEICGYHTVESGSFKKHVNIHNGKKLFKCPHCPYKAVTKYDVVKHARGKHLRQKKYLCNKCAFGTAYLSALTIHLMAHENIKPYKCSLCAYQSNMSNKVGRHMQQKHSNLGGKVIKLHIPFTISVKDYINPNVTPSSEIQVIHLSSENSDSMVQCQSSPDQFDEDSLEEALKGSESFPVTDISRNFELSPSPSLIDCPLASDPEQTALGESTNNFLSDTTTNVFASSQNVLASSTDSIRNVLGHSIQSSLGSSTPSVFVDSDQSVLDSSASVFCDTSHDLDLAVNNLNDSKPTVLGDCGNSVTNISSKQCQGHLSHSKMSPSQNVLLAYQCSRCLQLVMTPEELTAHHKRCTSISKV